MLATGASQLAECAETASIIIELVTVITMHCKQLHVSALQITAVVVNLLITV